MTAKKRPLAVILVALLYMAVGGIGFVSHLVDFIQRHDFGYDTWLVELTEALAVLAGIFLLRGANWARWLAIAWMAFHVVLSAFNSFSQAAVHAVFLALIAFALFAGAQASTYFRPAASGKAGP